MRDSNEFVPNGDSREETAVLLLGTAEEFGIDPRLVKATSGGFYIPSDLADIVFGEEPEDEKKAGPNKKSSGNKAEKSTGSEKE